MIMGFHSIFCAYGFWLPNDPRGSWSNYVAAWELLMFGRATKTDSRQSLAANRHNREHRRLAKQQLKYPEVVFDGYQALSIANGFGIAIAESGYVVHACSVMPQHVHMVIARTPNRKIERIVGHLKGRATQQLTVNNHHPLARHIDSHGHIPTPWAVKSWNVFLNSDDDMLRAICYVRDNPVREGKSKQQWSFVTPYIP